MGDKVQYGYTIEEQYSIVHIYKRDRVQSGNPVEIHYITNRQGNYTTVPICNTATVQ